MSASMTSAQRPTGSGVLAARCMFRRPTAISAAFRSSLIRKRQRLALVEGLKAGTARSLPSRTSRDGSAGTSCSPQIGSQGVCLLQRTVRLAEGRSRSRLGDAVSVVLRRRRDDRRHVQQAPEGSGSILAVLFQCRRYRRRRRARGKQPAAEVFEGPLELPGGGWIARCRDPQGAAFALQGKTKPGWHRPSAGFGSRLVHRVGRHFIARQAGGQQAARQETNIRYRRADDRPAFAISRLGRLAFRPASRLGSGLSCRFDQEM